MSSSYPRDLTVEPLGPQESEAEAHGPASHSPLQTVLRPHARPSPDPSSSLLDITDEVLLNFQRCTRRAFLDKFGNAEQRDPPSDYLQKLHQDSLAHQRSVLAEHPATEARYPYRDWAAGAQATLELMQQGAERISRGVLSLMLEDGSRLVGCPTLLVKQDGYSIFGDWCYVPVNIKLGKRPKLDYQIVAAFHAYILSDMQGNWPDAAWLVLRQRGAYAVDLIEQVPRMLDILEDCVEMLTARDEPEVFIARNRCDLCHWMSHCYDIAQSERHLSLLPGVTPSRYVHLKEVGLTTVEMLATIAPQRLAPLPGFGIHVASKLVRQAQSTLQNRALTTTTSSQDFSAPILSLEELPTAPIELYFDIEAAPEQNLIYLHGVLVVDRPAQTYIFHPLLAEHPDDEAQIWQQFLELVWRYPQAPIYHFCPYEVQTVKRLAKTFETPDHLIQPLIHRFVDLHERVTRVVALPIESYALKPIARWLGFDWRDQEANGAQSIYWYDQWLMTGDRTYLDAILRYNEDDCRATHHVKDWLVEFVKTEFLKPS